MNGALSLQRSSFSEVRDVNSLKHAGYSIQKSISQRGVRSSESDRRNGRHGRRTEPVSEIRNPSYPEGLFQGRSSRDFPGNQGRSGENEKKPVQNWMGR